MSDSAAPAPSVSVPLPQKNGVHPAGKDRNGYAHKATSSNGDRPKPHHENGSVASPAPVLSVLHPTVRMVDASETRDPVRLCPGGSVWVTADGSRLTAAVCAVLKERNYHPHVIKLDLGTAPVPDERLCGLIIIAPLESADDAFVKNAFKVLRAAAPALERSGAQGGAAFLTVSRLEGNFGLTGLAAGSSPISGALAGMAKTAGLEWRGVHCKAVDVAAGFESVAQTADSIVNELFERGPAEVGLSPEGRAVVALEPVLTRLTPDSPGMHLDRSDLVVISGGARGVTAEVAVALAESFGPRLVLLGRTPAPPALPDPLADCLDETQLKRALLERSNGRRALQDVGAEAALIMAQREIRRQLSRIEAAGSRVDYRSVDVRDGAAVKTVVAEIRREFGDVRALIHGAGVLADRRITDQTDSQFSLVYDTKVNGLRHLYEAIDPDALKCLILFSSSTARFGRSGQVAYAAANEAMNKWAQEQSVRLPLCRVVSYNWGPWAGGMVKDSLKPLFEKEGISLIPLDAGARLVVDRLKGPAGPVEVVVLAGSDDAVKGFTRMQPEAAPTPVANPKLETVFRRSVDLDSLPILASHIIDGHPVLPMALIQEWLAEAAVQRNPGLMVRGVDRLQLHKGVIVGKSHDNKVELRVGKAVRDGARFIVSSELRGTLASGREVAHARAEIVLADNYETAPRAEAESALVKYPRSRDEIYQTILFHGPAMRGIERVDGLSERAVAGWVATSPPPADWLEQPQRTIWLTDPLAIDSAIQLVILWSRERLGANSLPTAIGEYRQFRRAFPREGVRVIARIRQASDTRAVADITFLDTHGVLVARMNGYECVIDTSLNQAFRRNQVTPSLKFSRAE